jgi:hypothetical protein
MLDRITHGKLHGACIAATSQANCNQQGNNGGAERSLTADRSVASCALRLRYGAIAVGPHFSNLTPASRYGRQYIVE